MTAEANRFTIREAAPDDAKELIIYMLRLLGEPGIHLIGEQDEFTMTPEGERKLITELALTDNATMQVAVAGGRIVGVITCRGDIRRAKQHAGVIGISVAQEWRDQGVGSALMDEMIRWAKGTGIVTRLELLVFSENQRAVHVYEKAGFQIEGIKRRAIFKNGKYHDEYFMALLLEPEEE
jgi:RimJ/RimL family protein N-acetyltransferase